MRQIQRIVGLLIVALFFGVVPSAYSDEYYEFFRIMCADDLDYFHMDRLGIYNIGRVIWPYGGDNAWRDHIESLKELEEKYGLYVLDGAYGYWDNNTIECTVSNRANIRIEFGKATRPPGPVGSEEPYRVNPTVIIEFRNRDVGKFRLRPIDEVALTDMDGVVLLRICVVANPFDLEKNYRRKCREVTLYDFYKNRNVIDDDYIMKFLGDI